MKQIFTFKSVLIALLAMISCTMKAEIVEYKTNGGFAYSLDTETQEASLDKYRGEATEVVVPEFVAYKRKEYKVTGLGDGCFYGCSSLTSVELPSSVTSLGNECFGGCKSLVSIELPSSVTSLGNGCFRGCSSLTSIEIPSSVTTLGGNCFCDCSSLKTVICKMEKGISDTDHLFDGVLLVDATLYVSEEMLDTYKATDPWSRFGTILLLTEEQVSVDDTPELGIALNTNNGNVVVSGLADGTQVSCYTVGGRILGKASANGGTATFTAEPNSIVIVKVGKKTFKVYVK